jgi:hypothetical protein
MLLRIVGGPELAVEEGIGNARVRLIHSDHDAARGKGLRLRLVAALLRRYGRGRCFGQQLKLDVLALEYFGQLDLAVGVGRVGGDDIGRWTFHCRLQYRTFTLQIIVLKEMMGIIGEVRER